MGVSCSGCGLCVFCFTKSSYFQENQLSTVFHLAKRKWERFATKDSSFLIVFFFGVLIVDIATVVGFSVVSRPFLSASSTRHINSTHSERMEVCSMHF